MALRQENVRWYIPTGSEATSHILKPGIHGLERQAASEFITMKLAKEIGLPAAQVQYLEFESEPAICVERYDRFHTETGLLMRIHQEDMCQVFSIDPMNKYPQDGGPTTDMILDQLAVIGLPAQREKNREELTRALFFNYLVAAPDGHAKNYSILLMGDSVRLAPIYDTASGIHYTQDDGSLRYKTTAMRIGGEHKIGNLRRRHLKKFAERNHFSEEWVAEQMSHMTRQIPGALESVFDENAMIPAVTELRKTLLGKLTRYCNQAKIDLML
jgi:serine/threonine-protein kinase HipA